MPMKQKISELWLPDECERQDIIGIDGDEPVAVLGVRVGMWKVWG